MITKTKKNLIMLTSEYPFGKGETWLELEIKYLSKVFEHIIVIPQHAVGKKRITPENVEINSSFKTDFFKNVLLSIFDKSFWKFFLKNFKPCSRINYWLLAFIWAVNSSVYYIILKEIIGSDFEYVLYSQWFNGSALAIARIKKLYSHITAYTKCHRWDIYEEENSIPMFPYREFTLKNLDGVFPISQNGLKHLLKNYSRYKKVMQVARLGTEGPDSRIMYNLNNNIFYLVSCSNVVSVKRVGLIADALILLSNQGLSINWTHIGNGPLLDNIKRKLDMEINKNANITINFVGAIPNENVKKMYATKYYDLFINVSSSEGIPVSIMEAQSYGIPVMATNVGGVGEIVNDENGFLLPVDISVEDIANSLYEAIHVLKNNNQKREKSMISWNDLYNAKINYSKFANYLLYGLNN